MPFRKSLDRLQHTHPRAYEIARKLGISVQNRRLNGFRDPRINRNTGKPHEHRREIARHLRQLGSRASHGSAE